MQKKAEDAEERGEGKSRENGGVERRGRGEKKIVKQRTVG